MFSCGTCLGFLNKCEASLLKVELFLLCDSVYTKWSSGDTHGVGGTIRKGALEYSAGVSFFFFFSFSSNAALLLRWKSRMRSNSSSQERKKRQALFCALGR